MLTAMRRASLRARRLITSRHLPRSPCDGEVVWYVVWLNQSNIFVGMLRAQRIEQAPSDDASVLNLCASSLFGSKSQTDYGPRSPWGFFNMNEKAATEGKQKRRPSGSFAC
jgi:hypothetical protein